MKLDEDTWARIFPWIEKAQDVPSAKLEEWLAELALTQPDIAAPLREVLADHSFEDTDSFLPAARLVSLPWPPRTGEQAGAYTIDTLLAAGGMGEVWLAHRSDGNFEGRYAVKLPRHVTLGSKALDRFKREGRVLARLTHTNIARLMDAGAFPDGQPFMVLEYIDGLHIDKYCQSRSLSTRARVRLFLDVLEAVSHAHTRLIIHRDIKPSNVLVTAEGQVKLLDFGIAKLLGPNPEPVDLAQATRIEEIALTPRYAAPEQLLGEPLSTSTDVYQLGVLLHVLLAGCLPPQTLESVADCFNPTLTETAVRASDAVEGPLRTELRGDLDAIIEKALRKRPHERYPTAAEFSADLQRYLKHEPVTARAGLLAYRTQKFLRRYRAAVLGVTVVLASLIAATVNSLVQAHHTRLQRDRADQIASFMTQIFKVSDPSEARGNTVTAREILDKSSRPIESGIGLDPSVRSDLLQVMADTYTNLGLYARAHELAQIALDSRGLLLGADDPKTLQSREQLGNILFLQGHVAQAEESLRQTLTRELQALGPRHQVTLETQNLLVNLLLSKAAYTDGENLGRATLKIAAQTLGPHHVLTLKSMTLVAAALGSQNRFADSQALYRQTASIQRDVLGPDHPETLKTQFSLANMLRRQGRYAEAEALYREVLKGRRQVLGDEHPDTADTLTMLAIVLVHMPSRYKEAEELYRAALAIDMRQLGPDSRLTTRTEEGLGNLLGEEERYDEAEPYFREVLRVRAKLLGPDNTDTLLTQRNLACLLLAQGHLAQADELFRATLQRDQRVLQPNDRDILGVKYMLAETLLQERRPEEAEPLARQAFEAEQLAFGPQHEDTLHALNRLGRSLAALGRYAEAKALYSATIDRIANTANAELPKGWYAFATMQAQAGYANDAFASLQRAVELGFNDVEALRTDTELKSLRGDARFAKLLESARQG